MSTLDRAVAIAVEAHTGQYDRAGRPYILHPLRVMAAFQHEPAPHGEALRIIGVLHDVVEDNPAWSLQRLREEGFAQEVLKALDHLTWHKQSERYEDFIRRALANPLSRRVKIADLRDNMDLTRLEFIDDHTVARLRRYLAAWHEATRSEGSLLPTDPSHP